MKKIVIIGPSVKMGGMERASCNFANGLSEIGASVVYISIFKHERFFKLNKDVVFDEPTDGSNIKKLSLAKTVIRLRKQIQFYSPDSVFALNKFYASLTAFSLIGLPVPLFISERSSPFFKWRFKLRVVMWFAFKLRRPQGIVAQTTIASKFQRIYYGTRIPITVIPNIVRHVNLFPNVPRENFILAIGRLNDSLKGFDRLVDSVSKMKNKWPIFFAGGDQTGNALKQQAELLGISNRFFFLDKVTDLDLILARAGLFVMPSRSEGFPNALCEAMAAGVACVCFDFVAGPADLIQNGENGILVPDGEIEQLANAIDQLIENPDLRSKIGKNAMEVRQTLLSRNISNRLYKFLTATPDRWCA